MRMPAATKRLAAQHDRGACTRLVVNTPAAVHGMSLHTNPNQISSGFKPHAVAAVWNPAAT